MGFIILFLLLGINIGFLVYSLVTKSYQKKKRHMVRVALLLLLILLALARIVHWDFQWYILYLILFVKAVISIIYFVRRSNQKEKPYRKRYVLMIAIGNLFIILFAVFPAIIFPQYTPIKPTGDYKIRTASYTITDPERKETFSELEENRKVTIQFWYPEEENKQYPLLIFSHGAFGFRGSNASTFKNLASNGYVVCSIDHTYHSFYTKQADGKTVIADMKFVNDAMEVQQGAFDEQTTYEMSQEWLKLRLDDMNLVLNQINYNIKNNNPEEVYQRINWDKIGVFGHSLGGAASAQMGRDRKDIDAVIVVDGTMLGEEIGYQNGEITLNPDSYPIPLLNIYAEDHYQEAIKVAEQYANLVATENAVDARQVVIKDAGHLNFTDLPLFSPILASMLGTGEADRRACIETMNQIILDYFNYYLKNIGDLNLKAEYEP